MYPFSSDKRTALANALAGNAPGLGNGSDLNPMQQQIGPPTAQNMMPQIGSQSRPSPNNSMIIPPQVMPKRNRYEDNSSDFFNPYSNIGKQDNQSNINYKQKNNNIPNANNTQISSSMPQKEDDLTQYMQNKYGRYYSGGDTSSGGTLMDKLRNRESGGNYGAINKLGYAGAYQFGSQALEQVGYLKPGSYAKEGQRAMRNPENWSTGRGLDDFLKNRDMQDSAMRKLMENNRQRLIQMGVINKNTPQREVDGYLAASHLGGVGNIKKMMNGENPKDANGTGMREYFDYGRGSSVREVRHESASQRDNYREPEGPREEYKEPNFNDNKQYEYGNPNENIDWMFKGPDTGG